MPETEEKKINWFLLLISLSCAVTILSSFYSLYYKKNYDFIVEVSCDPSLETCFQRDCSNPDDCPPNGLSDFKRYTLKAYDFNKCENEDCTNACLNGLIECKQISCIEDLEAGESCSTPESTTQTN